MRRDGELEIPMSSFELDAPRAFPDEGPVTMINLVKYREQSLDGNGTGREAYARYTDVAQGLVEARGGKVLWAGVVEHPALHEGGDIDWDWGVLRRLRNAPLQPRSEHGRRGSAQGGDAGRSQRLRRAADGDLHRRPAELPPDS